MRKQECGREDCGSTNDGPGSSPGPTLILGMRALMWSAEVSAQEEGQAKVEFSGPVAWTTLRRLSSRLLAPFAALFWG